MGYTWEMAGQGFFVMALVLAVFIFLFLVYDFYQSFRKKYFPKRKKKNA